MNRCNISNSPIFWIISTDQRGSVVDPPSWVSHFEKLNQVKDEFKERLKNLEIQLIASIQ
jgi:hypothetical protein